MNQNIKTTTTMIIKDTTSILKTQLTKQTSDSKSSINVHQSRDTDSVPQVNKLAGSILRLSTTVLYKKILLKLSNANLGTRIDSTIDLDPLQNKVELMSQKRFFPYIPEGLLYLWPGFDSRIAAICELMIRGINIFLNDTCISAELEIAKKNYAEDLERFKCNQQNPKEATFKASLVNPSLMEDPNSHLRRVGNQSSYNKAFKAFKKVEKKTPQSSERVKVQLDDISEQLYDQYIENRLVKSSNIKDKLFISKEDLRNDFVHWVQINGYEDQITAIGGSLTSGFWINHIPICIIDTLFFKYNINVVTKKRGKKNGLEGVCLRSNNPSSRYESFTVKQSTDHLSALDECV